MTALRQRFADLGHDDNPFVTADSDDAIYTLGRLLELGSGGDGPAQRDAQVMAAHLPELLRKVEEMAAELDGA